MYQILLTFLFLFLLGNGGYIDNNHINNIICLRENSHPMYDIIGFKKKMIDGKYPCDHTYDTLTYDVSFYLHWNKNNTSEFNCTMSSNWDWTYINKLPQNDKQTRKTPIKPSNTILPPWKDDNMGG